MRSVDRGDAGEALVLTSLLRAGCRVLTPFGAAHAFDLAVLVGDHRVVRVQCKVAWHNGGCLEFNSAGTDHGKGNLSYLGRADVFGVADLDACAVYLVPVTEARTRMTRLRLAPTRNNQSVGVRMAADYTVERQLPGLLANLPA
jgi:hypothetical protein